MRGSKRYDWPGAIAWHCWAIRSTWPSPSTGCSQPTMPGKVPRDPCSSHRGQATRAGDAGAGSPQRHGQLERGRSSGNARGADAHARQRLRRSRHGRRPGTHAGARHVTFRATAQSSQFARPGKRPLHNMCPTLVLQRRPPRAGRGRPRRTEDRDGPVRVPAAAGRPR